VTAAEVVLARTAKLTVATVEVRAAPPRIAFSGHTREMLPAPGGIGCHRRACAPGAITSGG
jgi:hypothetical protein